MAEIATPKGETRRRGVFGVRVPGTPRWNEAAGIRREGGESGRMSGEDPPGYAGSQGEPAQARCASSVFLRTFRMPVLPPKCFLGSPFQGAGTTLLHQSSAACKATLIPCCPIRSSSSGRNTESRRGAAPAAKFSGASPLLWEPHRHHYPSRRLPRQISV